MTRRMPRASSARSKPPTRPADGRPMSPPERPRSQPRRSPTPSSRDSRLSDRIVSAPARIGATGMYVPQRVLTNADFEKMFETSDEWIVQRTGIRVRHVVSEGEYSSHLAIGAIDDLLAHHPQVTLREVDYLIVASTTPDYAYPSLSA